jgi:hypothetical protein
MTNNQEDEAENHPPNGSKRHAEKRAAPTRRETPPRPRKAGTEGAGIEPEGTTPRLSPLEALSLAQGQGPAQGQERRRDPEQSGAGTARAGMGHAIEVEDSGDLARLHLNVELSWPLALTILRLVRGAEGPDDAAR